MAEDLAGQALGHAGRFDEVGDHLRAFRRLVELQVEAFEIAIDQADRYLGSTQVLPHLVRLRFGQTRCDQGLAIFLGGSQWGEIQALEDLFEPKKSMSLHVPRNRSNTARAG